MSERAQVEIGKSLDEIAQEAKDVREQKLAKTDNPETEWYAYFKSRAGRVDEAFVTGNCGLYLKPVGEIDDDEIDFFLTYSREGAIDLGAYPVNYLETALKMEETQAALDSYETEVQLSQEAQGKSIEETLENLGEETLEAKIEVSDTQGFQDRDAYIMYQNGEIQSIKFLAGLNYQENKELRDELEQLLVDEDLIRHTEIH